VTEPRLAVPCQACEGNPQYQPCGACQNSGVRPPEDGPLRTRARRTGASSIGSFQSDWESMAGKRMRGEV